MKKWNNLNLLWILLLIISACGDDKIISDEELIGGEPPEDKEF